MTTRPRPETLRATISVESQIAARDGSGHGPIPEALIRELVELGLSPSEARVLVALMRVGTATSPQLARVSAVPRTSIYQVLDALSAKRLASRVPGKGAAVWACAGRQEVMERLEELLTAAQEERLRIHRAKSAAVDAMLAEQASPAPSVAAPLVQVIHGATDARKAYERMLDDARDELIMFTRPPYTWRLGDPNKRVMAMLARGVPTRVLYQEAEVRDPSAAAFREEMEAYHRAGVRARCTTELPMKLVVVDRKLTLVGIEDPAVPEEGFPVNLLIAHTGFARVQMVAFERLWEAATPYEQVAAELLAGVPARS